MRALSIRQPWAWAIVSGFKDIENRDWRTNYRGRVLVHAGKKEDEDDCDWLMEQVANGRGWLPEFPMRRYRDQMHLGAIVGAVTITDCIEQSDSPWFFGKFGFVLRDPIAIKPVPCRGKLGFFKIPDEVAAQIKEQAAA